MPEQEIHLHRITSTAIVCKAGKYLITQRSLNKKVFPGKWHVPGGGLAVGDYKNSPKNKAGQWYFAVENSLRREIREEVGLEVKKLKFLLDLAFIRPDGIPVATLSYWAQYKSGKVKLDEDSIDYKWVTLAEAKKYDLIDGIWEEIEMVDKILEGADSDRVKYSKK